MMVRRIGSRRHAQRAAYFAAALSVLQPAVKLFPKLKWLVDVDKNRVSFSILAELGRINDLACLILAARYICNNQLRGPYAIDAIHRFLFKLDRARRLGLPLIDQMDNPGGQRRRRCRSLAEFRRMSHPAQWESFLQAKREQRAARRAKHAPPHSDIYI